MLRFFAIGLRRFKTDSSKSLIFVDEIFISLAVLSNLTRDNRSLMILLSRSISSAMSTKNSRYNSGATFSCINKESAKTFTEVKGVFNSWETLETNSCLDFSRFFILKSI